MENQFKVGDYIRTDNFQVLEVTQVKTVTRTEFPECPHCFQDYPVEVTSIEMIASNGQIFALPTERATKWYPFNGELCLFKVPTTEKEIIVLQPYDTTCESKKQLLQQGKCVPFIGNAPKFKD